MLNREMKQIQLSLNLAQLLTEGNLLRWPIIAAQIEGNYKEWW